MRKAINFIKGSVSTSNMIPALKRINLFEKQLFASNGIISAKAQMQAPGVTFSVDGKLFCDMLELEGDINIKLIKSNKLRLDVGNVKMFLPATTVVAQNEDEAQLEQIELVAPILPTLRKVVPYIAVDNTAYWASGVLISRGIATVTNSIVILKAKIGIKSHTSFVVPLQAVHEIIRINEEPIKIALTAQTLVLYYTFNRTLRISLIDATWPDTMSLFKSKSIDEAVLFPPYFFDKLKKLKKFSVDRTVYIKNGTMNTMLADEHGVSVEVDSSVCAAFDLIQLLALEGVAVAINFDAYPEEPCVFVGENIVGAIAGRLLK